MMGSVPFTLDLAPVYRKASNTAWLENFFIFYAQTVFYYLLQNRKYPELAKVNLIHSLAVKAFALKEYLME